MVTDVVKDVALDVKKSGDDASDGVWAVQALAWHDR